MKYRVVEDKLVYDTAEPGKFVTIKRAKTIVITWIIISNIRWDRLDLKTTAIIALKIIKNIPGSQHHFFSRVTNIFTATANSTFITHRYCLSAQAKYSNKNSLTLMLIPVKE